MLLFAVGFDYRFLPWSPFTYITPSGSLATTAATPSGAGHVEAAPSGLGLRCSFYLRNAQVRRAIVLSSPSLENAQVRLGNALSSTLERAGPTAERAVIHPWNAQVRLARMRCHRRRAFVALNCAFVSADPNYACCAPLSPVTVRLLHLCRPDHPLSPLNTVLTVGLTGRCPEFLDDSFLLPSTARSRPRSRNRLCLLGSAKKVQRDHPCFFVRRIQTFNGQVDGMG